MLPGDWDLAHAIRLGIKPFAELGANSEALSGSQVDSSCSCRAILESTPVAMLQSRKTWEIFRNPGNREPPGRSHLSSYQERLCVRLERLVCNQEVAGSIPVVSIQFNVAVHQHQPRQHTAQAEQEYQQTFLELPKRPFLPKAEADQFLERLSSFRQDRFLGGWTDHCPDLRLTIHGAYSEPRLCGAQRCGVAVEVAVSNRLFSEGWTRNAVGVTALRGGLPS